MSPYPEEIDVFSAPHSRMKELVDVYSEKLTYTDFSDWFSLESLLRELHHTFCEFKSHEQIENNYILQKLKSRLKMLSVEEDAVCNCHSDNRLSEMLALVEEGQQKQPQSEKERLSFGKQLRAALHDFTRTFLPHMRQEEEVFQPMLMKYFEYEELKCLKQQVIQEHIREKIAIEEAEADLKLDCDRSLNELMPHLPPEIVEHVLSTLSPQERLTCARVCHEWQEIVLAPQLWSNIYPAYWIHGFWEEDYQTMTEENHEERIQRFYGNDSPMGMHRDEDADVEEDEEEGRRLRGLVKNLLPQIGHGVKTMVIASCRSLNSPLLRSILRQCPNLTYLDVSHTAIMDSAFKGLNDYGCLKNLQHLNLTGCSGLSDLALLRLSECMETSRDVQECNFEIEDGCRDEACASVCSHQRNGILCRLTRMRLQCPRGFELHSPPLQSSLSYLNLSGCSDITDRGLRCLLEAGALDELCFLDLSGCWGVRGDELCAIVARLPHLPPQQLSYCDNVTDGPHPSQANGCQNVGQPNRHCCRKDFA